MSEVPVQLEPELRLQRGTLLSWSAPGVSSGPLHRSDIRKAEVCFDLITVAVSALLSGTLVYELNSPHDVPSLFIGALKHPENLWRSALFLLGFTVLLVLNSRRLGLYERDLPRSVAREQRFTVWACLLAGALPAIALHWFSSGALAAQVVLHSMWIATVLLSARRMSSRLLLYRRVKRGLSTRHIAIVGTGPTAQAVRADQEKLAHLGHAVQGFIRVSPRPASLMSTDVIGSIDTLYETLRRHFIDEIIVAGYCGESDLRTVLREAEDARVDVRYVPEMDTLLRTLPRESLDQLPSATVRFRQYPEFQLHLKRALDILASATLILLVLPMLVVIGLAVKFDSRGPVFYSSKRVGRKGRIFNCLKFRTMVPDAEKLKNELLSMNERDGVLFKITSDPRITRIGRILRKYSLDELPQLFNVLSGDMSLVGPRPPLMSEVVQYQPDHLVRLDVQPGITGLWQVMARSDPSFDQYISMDRSYVENWSFWLDIKILMRTVGVVLAGTGS